MKNDILCRECSDRYVTIVASETRARSERQRLSAAIEQQTKPSGQFTQSVLVPASEESEDQNLQIRKTLEGQLAKKIAPEKIGYFMLGIGALALILSVIFASTILAFIGLGLTFWGLLVFFVRPQK